MRDRVKLLSVPLLITMTCWGFNFVSLKILYREVSPEAVSLSRCLLMWGFLALFRKLRGESLKPARRDVGSILFLGFVMMGVYMVVFLSGLQHTGAGEGAIVLATVPLITPVLAALMRVELFSLAAAGGAMVAFAGVACVAFGSSAAVAAGHDLWRGDLMILASAFCWSFSIVLAKPLLKRYSPLQVLTMSMPGALPALLPFGLLATLQTPWTHLTPGAWANFAQVVLLSGVVAFSLFNVGLKQVGPSSATLYQFLVPPLAALFSYLLLGQTLTWIQWIGFAIVVAGVYAGSVARQRAVRNEAMLQAGAESAPTLT